MKATFIQRLLARKYFLEVQEIHKNGCSGRATSERSNVVVKHNHPPDLFATKKDQVVSHIRKWQERKQSQFIGFIMKHYR